MYDVLMINQSESPKKNEFARLLKKHGTPDYNLRLHSTLVNSLVDHFKTLKKSKGLVSAPFKMTMKKIVEIEKRIEKYMDLMLDLGIPLPKHIENYIQLRDLVKEYETTESNQQSQVVDAKKDELEMTSRQLEVAQNIVKKLRRRTRFKLADMTDSDLENIADDTRMKNGKINYTKMGNFLGVSRETVRREITKRKLTYLINSY